MDEIFRSNPGAFVFRNKELTQRERPARFMDEEKRRIEKAGEAIAHIEVAKGAKHELEIVEP